MTDDRLLERAARSWIEIGPTRAPDRAVEAALLRIESTSQERDLVPWRFGRMTFDLRLGGIAAAAVVILLVAGTIWVGRSTLPPSSSPSPSPSTTPSGGPSVGPSAAAATQVPTLPPLGLTGRLDVDAAALGIIVPNPQPLSGILTGGVDLGPDGNLYLISDGTAEVVVLTADGTLVRRWGRQGDAAGEFRAGWSKDIGVAPDGTVYVSESSQVDVTASVPPRIQAFTPDGRLIRSWGTYGPGDGEFKDAYAVDIGPDGSVYVVDDVRNVISRFRPDGTYVSTIGAPGTGPGQMHNTGVIRLGPDGTIYNADWGTGRIQAWTADGTFLWATGSEGVGPGQLIQPRDLAIGSDGRIYVLDNRRIQVFDTDHSPVAESLAPFQGVSRLLVEGSHLWLVGGEGDVTHVIRFTLVP
jgi:sugar lactone lactonase YvrE